MHYDRCNVHKPGMLLQLALGLIITAKLPARYDSIIQDAVKTNTPVPATICELAIAIFEGAQSFEHNAPRGGGQANLANAVKHKPAGNPQWHGGNSGSLGSKPRFDAKKKGNSACSDTPNCSGKGLNGKRCSKHAHAATADNLSMHFAALAVHVDAALPQVCPTAMQLQHQAAYTTWPQGVPSFSKAVAYCDNVGTSLDSAAFVALADVTCAGVGEHSNQLNAGCDAGLRACASACNQPLCNQITLPLVTPANEPHRIVSKRRHTQLLAEQLGDVASEVLLRSSTTGTYRNVHKDSFKPPHLVCSTSEEQG
jgi:hypothetical protein